MKKFFAKNNEGATGIEYAIIASLISIVLIAALTIIGTETHESFSMVSSNMSAANDAKNK